MKQELIRYTLALVVFSFCILGLACPAPQDQAVNNANNAAEETVEDAAASSTCDSTTLQTRIDKVKAHLENKLSGMLDPGVFEVKVEPYMTDNISVSFLGKIHGLDGSNNPNLKKLSGALKGLAKSKCVVNVKFGPIPTPLREGEKASESLAAPGFEWDLCEDPQRPCPDGSCMIACKAIMTPSPEPDSTTNSN